jgi:ADP-heptose:LPS heptosyltransferase
VISARTLNRMRTLGRAALSSMRPAPRARPENPRRILVLHELLLGDTLMLAPLLARLRARHPGAEITVTARPEVLPLFSGRPYGVVPLAFSERDAGTLERLDAAARDCDLAIVPGENRYTLNARGLGAGWIVAFGGARPGWKNWAADQLIEFPARPANLGDIFAELAGPEPADLHYRRGDWPAPACKPFTAPAAPYAVLHVGASTPLKYWDDERWRALAERLSPSYRVVWSCGPRETDLVRRIDPQARFASYPGTLDLAQLWQLVARSSLLVTLDTGIAHLGKLTLARTVCLFGPGSAALTGRGEFFRDAPFTEVTVADFPCRDQHVIFGRDVAWARVCRRSVSECARPRCMEAIALEDVMRAIGQ